MDRPTALSPLPDSIPAQLRSTTRWVLWRHDRRGADWVKVPYRPDGASPARSNDPSTWGDFGQALARHRQGGFDGVGLVLAAGDGLVGIDLDDCRDSTTGILTAHARRVLSALRSYAEVSPSGRGVKCLVRGGKPDARCLFKTPGWKVEVYAQLRYFALTGHALPWLPATVRPAQAALDHLFALDFFAPRTPRNCAVRVRHNNVSCGRGSAMQRAMAYVGRCPPAVSGCNGHGTTYRVSNVLLHGFGLPAWQALAVLIEYNRRCVPPWSHRELEHKILSATMHGTYRDLLQG